MGKIKFVPTKEKEKEKDLLSRDWLPINKFKAWKINSGKSLTNLRNVLRKYLEGREMCPDDFNLLDYRQEQAASSVRTYFRPSQVLSFFSKMRSSEIQNMFDKVNQEKRLMRGYS